MNRTITLAATTLFTFAVAMGRADAADESIRVMIVSGQNNHKWQESTPFLKQVLDAAGHFNTVVSLSPEQGAAQEEWDQWQPDFSQVDCIVLDYNGQMWPEPVKQALVDYVKRGGGVLSLHASNNAFTGWKEYEEMIGMLWRPASYGASPYLDDEGKLHREAAGKGRGMGHGSQYDWHMTTRDAKHPVTRDMPRYWMHKHDELYHGQRGPARNFKILLSAYSDPAPGRGGTGLHEPIVWWIPYGKGKVITNVMGHVGELDCLQCVGFQVLLCRSCEWLATGRCLTEIPADFPNDDEPSVRIP